MDVRSRSGLKKFKCCRELIGWRRGLAVLVCLVKDLSDRCRRSMGYFESV